jgi:GT2 family glycosyltransferase/glycosyltransferase involved in cell wall biosynthesis
VKSLPPFVKDKLLTAPVFQRPWFVMEPLAWAPHIPFSFWLVEELRPRVVVELGTHMGNSFFALCQQIKESEVACEAYAVDTWRGDEHAGAYGEEIFRRVQDITNQHFASFARLIRSSFDDALEHFSDRSIDLLHIDGLHTYEAVKHDFETWFPKLSDRSVVLFHDTNVREGSFGVWRFWKDVAAKYPSFNFVHGHGLGVLLTGARCPDVLKEMCTTAMEDLTVQTAVREIFDALGTTGSDAREKTIIANSIVDEAQKAMAELRRELQREGEANGLLRVELSEISALLESERQSERHARDTRASELDEIRSARDALSHEVAELTQAKLALESSASARSVAIRELEASIAFREAAMAQLAAELRTQVNRNQALFDAKTREDELHRLRASDFLADVLAWQARWKNRVDELRGGFAWRLFRNTLRFGALVLRGEDEGRKGFLRWLWNSLTNKPYPLMRSFDPFEDLFEEAPRPKCLGSFGAISSPLPAILAERPVEPARPVEPLLRRSGKHGPGRVDVVIPVKGSIQWVSQCLSQLFACSSGDELAGVFLVDDGSSADELHQLALLAEQYETVSIIENVAPRGFAGACNAGASVSTAPLILFLNSDCLVTTSTISSMVRACDEDESVGLVTALSNNAGTLSVTIPPGFSFIDVSKALAALRIGGPDGERFVNACTVVGHCLLATRSCFRAVGGFDLNWGLGYGEESDLQMRAMQLGYRGVVPLDTFVYHFGGGTFRYEDSRAELQTENHARFLALWGDQYRTLLSESALADPVSFATKKLEFEASRVQRPDVLFVLPGIRHAVGGVMAVLDLCNHLITHGMNAKALILGEFNREALRNYPEALYFAPLHAASERDLFSMGPALQPKVVVSTLFTTAQPARGFAALCGARFVSFVQGYEFYFDNGAHYGKVKESYSISDISLTTSQWLADGICRHNPKSNCYLIPLGIDPWTNFAAKEALRSREKIRVGIVLRHSPDKGQWLLRELTARMTSLLPFVSLSLFASQADLDGLDLAWSESPDTLHIILPIDRYRMGQFLRQCDILVDASLHEGFGLIPLEAMGSGCVVIASDSGGIRQFLEDGVNGLIVESTTSPDAYLAKVEALIRDRDLLARLRAEALETSRSMSWDRSFEGYRAFFEGMCERSMTGGHETFRYISEAVGPRNWDKQSLQDSSELDAVA